MTMFRFYLRLVILFIPLFVLFAITMSALGSTQPLHPALRGFVEGCEGVPQPCWYGVVSLRIQVHEVEARLNSVGYSGEYLSNNGSRNYVSYSNADADCHVRVYYTLKRDNTNLTDEFDLYNCHTLYLADVMNMFG